MTDCVPTCSEYSIDVPAPKDAENRKVPLDTKVMYDASGNEFEVRWLTYSTGPYGQGWSVKAYDRSDGDSSDDRGYTLPLDSLNIEKPDYCPKCGDEGWPMITDEKRREVAKELRDQAEAWRNIMPDIRMSDRRLTDSIHMAFGLNDKDTPVHEALGMLADIIEGN